jgi:hypothetical protein
MMRDPLLDWLAMYRNGEYKNTSPRILSQNSIISIGNKAPKLSGSAEPAEDEDPLDNIEEEDLPDIEFEGPMEISVPESTSTYMFILEQGNQFENAVIAYLRQAFPGKIEQIAQVRLNKLL